MGRQPPDSPPGSPPPLPAPPEQHAEEGGWSGCWRRPARAFWNNGVACALGSSLGFALAAAFVKTLHNRVPVFQIVVVRAIVSFAITGLSCRANGVPLWGKTAPQGILIARGVIGGTAMTAAYEGLVRLPLADSTVIFYLSPAITAIVCWLVLGETFGWLTAAGCAASLLGVVLVAQPPWLLGGSVEWSHTRMLGMAFGLVSAALAAGAYTCIRVIGKREHPLTIAMYFHSFAFVSAAIPLACGYPEPAVVPTPLQAVTLLGIACGSFCGNLLVNRAFQLEQGARASACNFSQVIFAYIFGTVFFHDPVTFLGLIGTGLIAGGVIAVQVEKALKMRKDLPVSHPAATGGTAGAEAGRPEHSYQPLVPDGQQAAAPASWWRRLWARAGGVGGAAAAAEQQLAPDYRGRLKAKRSGRFNETELGVLHEGDGDEIAVESSHLRASNGGLGGGGGGRAAV